MTQRPFRSSLAPQMPEQLTAETTRPAVFTESVLSKAVTDKLVDQRFKARMRNKDGDALPPATYLSRVANKTLNNVNDAENTRQILSDIELAEQVLVSSVLAPQDMISFEITHSSEAELLGDLLPPMVDVVDTHFKTVYKIKDQLPIILKEALFRSGAAIYAILPESAIDAAINGGNTKESLESIRLEMPGGKPLHRGILGNSSEPVRQGVSDDIGFSLGLESHELTRQPGKDFTYNPQIVHSIMKESNKTEEVKLPVYVSDNFISLKLPALKQRLVDLRLRDAMKNNGLTLESRKIDVEKRDPNAPQGNYSEELNFPKRNYKYNPMLSIKTLDELDKPTVGHPAVLWIPSESCIPVHTPSDPSDHLGYYIIQDMHGNPVRLAQTADYFADITTNAQGFRNMSSQLLAQTRRAEQGRADNDNYVTQQLVEEAAQMYGDIIERDLRNRMKHGIYGDNVAFGRPDLVYLAMLARHCANEMTQLLFIPANLVTYFAYDYNENGVGRSLLERNKILGALRGIIQFSNVMAGVKNSINHKVVNVELDPDEPDPSHIVEQISHEVARMSTTSFPLGVSNPVNLTHFLQNAGTYFNISGHPGWMSTKVDIENRQAGNIKPDTELAEDLRKQYLMSLGIAPETVDLSMNVEFATQVVSSNILLAKRAMAYQDTTCEHAADFERKYILNSGPLMQELSDIIMKNKGKVPALADKADDKINPVRLINYFLQHLKLSLPRPDLSRIEMQKVAFENMSTFLDAAIPMFISSEMYDSTLLGEIGNSIEATTKMLKASMMRQWMRENNILPELFKLTEFEDENAPDFLEMHQLYLKGFNRSMLSFMKHMAKTAAKSDDALNQARGGDEGMGGDNTETQPEETPGGETTPGEDNGDLDFGPGSSNEEETPPEDNPDETKETKPEEKKPEEKPEPSTDEEKDKNKKDEGTEE